MGSAVSKKINAYRDRRRARKFVFLEHTEADVSELRRGSYSKSNVVIRHSNVNVVNISSNIAVPPVVLQAVPPKPKCAVCLDHFTDDEIKAVEEVKKQLELKQKQKQQQMQNSTKKPLVIAMKRASPKLWSDADDNIPSAAADPEPTSIGSDDDEADDTNIDKKSEATNAAAESSRSTTPVIVECNNNDDSKQPAPAEAVPNVTTAILTTCCKQPIHRACLVAGFNVSLKSRMFPCKCPQCRQPMSEATLQQVCDREQFEKFLEISLRDTVDNNAGLYFHCPTPGCDYVVARGDVIPVPRPVEPAGNPYGTPSAADRLKRAVSSLMTSPPALEIPVAYTQFDCAKCHVSLCMRCQQQAHPDRECAAAVLAAMKQHEHDMEKRGMKKCLQCHMFIEKSDGCNKMTCRCGFQFCYACNNVGARCSCNPGHGFYPVNVVRNRFNWNA